MIRLGRPVPCALLLAVTVACGGCGGHGRALPTHGIVFAHTADPVGGTLDGGDDLYLWRPGARLRRLTSSPDPQGEPAWSPDGKQIAFAMTLCSGGADCIGRLGEVFVARSDGSHQRELTTPAGNELRTEYPSWSPDGRHIAALRELYDYPRVVTVSVASGKSRPLQVRGAIDDPVWGRPGIAYLNHQGEPAKSGAVHRRAGGQALASAAARAPTHVMQHRPALKKRSAVRLPLPRATRRACR